jgi:hypothetical protein
MGPNGPGMAARHLPPRPLDGGNPTGILSAYEYIRFLQSRENEVAHSPGLRVGHAIAQFR